MNKHRDVFNTDKANRIVVKNGELARMWVKNGIQSVHVLGMNGKVHDVVNFGRDESSDIEIHDVLVPIMTIANKEIPNIISMFRTTYPGEHVYMFIRVVGPEDMSDVGFASCSDELVYNPHGHIRKQEDVSQSMIDRTKGSPILPIAEHDITICPGCLAEIKDTESTTHCTCCNLQTHTRCIGSDEVNLCASCVKTLRTKSEGTTKVMSKLRTTCAGYVLGSGLIDEGERAGLIAMASRAEDLSQLNALATRFHTTNRHSVTELSKRPLSKQEVIEIAEEEVKRFMARSVSAAMGNCELPKGLSNPLEFTLQHSEMSKEALLGIIRKILNPSWVRSIARGACSGALQAQMSRFSEPLEITSYPVVKRVDEDN